MFIGMTYQNPTQLGSSNLTYKCSTMSHYYCVKKSKVTSHVVATRHESQKHCRSGRLHSCECWLLLVPFGTTSTQVRWLIQPSSASHSSIIKLFYGPCTTKSRRRSHCRCCKMFTFPCPTTWRPEHLA